MATYLVVIKYADPGKPKTTTQNIRVQAESESEARELAPDQFRNSNPTYKNKDVDVVEVRRP